MMNQIWCFFCFLFFFSLVKAQESKVTNHVYEGNEQASKGKYVQAEVEYRKAISIDPEVPSALYNLGNSHYREKQFDEASQRFFQTQKFAKGKSEKHRAFHNMGNVFMQKKEYEKAVEAYKNALRNNPEDEETRYNYALAKELLEKQNQNKDQQDKDKENQDDKKKNDKKEEDKGENDKKEPEKDDDKNKESNPEKDGDKQQDRKPEDDKGENESPPKQKSRGGQLSPEQVKSLLEAMNNQEKNVQEKVNAQKVKGTPVKGQKDW